jgi:hypothetical protein
MYLKENRLEKLEKAYQTLYTSDYDYFGEHLQHFYLLLTEDEILNGFLNPKISIDMGKNIKVCLGMVC